MGSLNVAGHSGKDFSVRSSSPDVVLKIRTVGDGLVAAYRAEGNLAAIRKRKREYRVGTTRSKLKRFDLSLKILAGFEINNIEGARQHSVITPTVLSALWLALGSLVRLFRNRRDKVCRTKSKMRLA